MAAGNAVIGALRVTLAADTATFETGLKSVESSISKFAKSAAAGFAAVGAAVGLAVGAVGVALQRTIDDMDKLNKTSQKLGITVEALSELNVAAALADVSFEELSRGVVKLSKNMTEAAAKPTSEAALAFRSLGISVTDAQGKLKSSDTVLAEVADKFSGLKDGAGKTAAAVAIFGRAGADLIPLLNEGRASLESAKKEAQEFGVVVSGPAAKAAEAFNDNLTRSGFAVKGIFVQALEAVLPTMKNLSDAFVEALKTSGALKAGIDILTGALKTLISTGIIVTTTFQAASAIWIGFGTAIRQAIGGDLTGAVATLQSSVASITDTSQKAAATIKGLWDGSTKAANDSAVATEKANKAQKDYNFSAISGKNAIDQFIASQQKKLAGQQAEIAQFGQLKGAQEANKLLIEADTIARTNNLTITASQRAALDAIAASTLQYGAVLEGLQLKQANLTPAQTLQVEQEKINRLFQLGAIDAETYGNAMQKAAEKAGATWDLAGASIAGSFKEIATSFGKENSKMATLAKIFGAIQTTISMFTGAAKALELPFPANLAAAAAVLAKGASFLASIKSQSVPGAAQGLSVQVPGGLGGGDSKLFQAMVEPGEHINVTPNSQTLGSSNVVVTVKGLTDKRYQLDEVKQIMLGIGDAMKFGYKFESA